MFESSGSDFTAYRIFVNMLCHVDQKVGLFWGLDGGHRAMPRGMSVSHEGFNVGYGDGGIARGQLTAVGGDDGIVFNSNADVPKLFRHIG